jgi:hypothetical protein
LGRFSKNTKGFQYFAWPDLEEYARLVKNYSERNLMYVEDVHPAFTGITTTLSRTFQGGFLHGLPEVFFDVALLWQPKSLVYASKFSKFRPQATGLPSWSWPSPTTS